MGQEILYCFKCQERVTSADLDAANGLRFGNRVACKKCVPDLIAGLSPKEQKELVARVQSPPPTERRASLTPRPRPSPATRVQAPPSAAVWWGVGGVVAVVLFVVAAVALSGPGTPPPEEVAKPVPRGPEVSPRERTAREALAKAKAVPSSNLDAQIAAYAEAMKVTEGTSHHREATEMHEGLLGLRRKALLRELSVAEERARVHLQKEEFGAALAIFEAVRSINPGPEWKILVDDKVQELRKRIDATFAEVQEQAVLARGKGADAELRSLRERVARWGLAERAAELETALQSVPAPGADIPWIPLFDGKSADFLTGKGEGAWIIENGTIVHVKGKNIAAQTRRVFADGELRVRFQHRDLTDLTFCIRQGVEGHSAAGWTGVQLRAMEGVDHELVMVFHGSDVSATLDGKPMPVEHFGKSVKGHFQFNARGDFCAIKSIEFREDSESLGLLAYWPLDSTQNGKTPDGSGNKNDGKLEGPPLPVPVAGRVGGGLQFDGKRSYVQVAHSPSLEVTGPLTVALWLNITVGAGELSRGLVEKWGDSGSERGGFLVRISTRGRAYFKVFSDGDDAEVSSPKTLAAGQWTHVAGVCDGNAAKLYINGKIDRTNAFVKFPRASTAPLRFGMGGGGGSHYFDGMLDDIRIYNRALSAEEIARLAARGR